MKKNRDGKLLDTDLGDDFLNLTSEVKAIKAKIIKWDRIIVRSLCTTKETIKK